LAGRKGRPSWPDDYINTFKSRFSTGPHKVKAAAKPAKPLNYRTIAVADRVNAVPNRLNPVKNRV
jgi:hypothetical protein